MEEFNWIHLALTLIGAITLVYSIRAIKTHWQKPKKKRNNDEALIFAIVLIAIFMALSPKKSKTSFLWPVLFFITLISVIIYALL
jgi:cell division protein FtsW (lipid II flippase)